MEFIHTSVIILINNLTTNYITDYNNNSKSKQNLIDDSINNLFESNVDCQLLVYKVRILYIDLIT